MILRWVIVFSAATLGLSGLELAAATFEGTVEVTSPTGKTLSDASDVLIYLEPQNAQAAPVPRRAVMIQKGKTFVPHLLAINVGSTVEFPNLDPIFHNAFSSFNGQIFDIGLYPPGQSRSITFRRPGIVHVFCNIHPAMSAVIVVLDTPYWVIVNRDGSYLIRNVPSGDYGLRVFQERATPETLSSLSRTVVIENKENRIPQLLVSQAGYLPVPHKNKYGNDYPDESKRPDYVNSR